MKNIRIPTISSVEFNKRLKTHEYEDIEAINKIEKLLSKKRGYVFRMPSARTPVILFVSGGVESIITWGLLLEKFKLNVYPIFLVYGNGLNANRREKKAVNYFSNYFQKKYPKLFHPVHTYRTLYPPRDVELLSKYPTKYLHPKRLLEQYNLLTKSNRLKLSTNVSSFIMSLYGVLYASYLFDCNDVKINTIFNGISPGDGIFVKSQTFTALRSILLATCLTTNDFEWQISSVAFEKELGYWLEKPDLLKLAVKLDIPLKRTWSCYRQGIYQCGNRCTTCGFRRLAFQRAGIKDNTHYESDDFWFKKIRHIKKIGRLILDKVGAFI